MSRVVDAGDPLMPPSGRMLSSEETLSNAANGCSFFSFFFFILFYFVFEYDFLLFSSQDSFFPHSAVIGFSVAVHFPFLHSFLLGIYM